VKAESEVMMEISDSESSSEDDEGEANELPEFVDWRAKKGHK